MVALLPLLAGVCSCAFAGFDKLGLGLGVVAALLALVSYGRPVSRAGAWTGVLVLGLIVATTVQVLAPVTAFVFAWPLALASLAAASSALSARKGDASLIAIAVLAAIGVGWVGGLAHGAYLALDLVELLGMPLLLTALLLWPLAQPARARRRPGWWARPADRGPRGPRLGALQPPYDARHPQVSYVGYHIDQDTRQAWRFSQSPSTPPGPTRCCRPTAARSSSSTTGPIASRSTPRPRPSSRKPSPAQPGQAGRRDGDPARRTAAGGADPAPDAEAEHPGLHRAACRRRRPHRAEAG